MAFTQQQLDDLDEAITAGELEVTFADGRKVRYRSIKELKEARRIVAQRLAGKRRIRAVRMTTCKG
ncbi:hypothetical protein GZ77_09100 [Endozoicomonas montiporae]|uniref:Uncharacterized protein n=2 Tax=Endozoicomonas montiporae TaxID=1027273 RepID=A0A081N7S6_9GAMM|nr:hypothetical protein [Endozoicomonas montiporae]AMO55638.1 hypothetical protein EZMO1_1469 [Endozoicomonas montiporae CL-33]KEQ14499.1 hypothetical protein GZ77_09100 [Endozoicomonas montiporae]